MSVSPTVGGLHSLHSNSPSLPQWLTDVEKDDMQMLIGKTCPIYILLQHYYNHFYKTVELASLTHSQLMEKVKTLQTLAYQLGMIEGEIARGVPCL